MGRLTARNERQARLWGVALYGGTLNPKDLHGELEASCRDREELIELRDEVKRWEMVFHEHKDLVSEELPTDD